MRSKTDNGSKGGCPGSCSEASAAPGLTAVAMRAIGSGPCSRIAFRASDVFPHLPFAPFRALFFVLLAVIGWGYGAPANAAEPEIQQVVFTGAKFPGVKEALIESIEGTGLVVTAVIPFNRMLDRTAGDLGRRSSPFSDATVVQFCSARLAWQLIEEEAAQMALCPMSMVVFEKAAEPGKVFLAYRLPGGSSAAQVAGRALLLDLAARTAELVRLGW